MSAFLRAFGPPVVLTAPLTIGLTITGNPAAFTLDQTDAAYPILGVGATVLNPVKYRFTDFMIDVWTKLRQWIFSAGVAQGLAPVGSVQDVELTLEITFPDGDNDIYADAVRINLSIPQGGLGFVGTTITAMSAVDSVTASDWGYLLGLYQQSAASQAFTLDGTVWRLNGQFQPRGITVLLRSEQDSGEYEERQDYNTIVLGSGKVQPNNYGFAKVFRDLRLVSLHPFELAPQFHLGSLLAIDVTRTHLTFPNPDTTGANSSGVKGIGSTPPGLQTDRLAIGDLVRVAEQWWARVRAISIPAPGAGAIDITLWDVIPTNIAPVAGAPIYKIAEVHSMVLESLRLGGIFVYDVDDVSGEWRASGPLYHLNGAGKLLIKFERQQPQASDRFSFSLNLVRSSAPGLVVIS